MKNRSRLLLSVSALALSMYLPAAAYAAPLEESWTGGSSTPNSIPCPPPNEELDCDDHGNSNWSDSDNWSGGVPGSDDTVDIGLATQWSTGVERPTSRDTVIVNTGNASAYEIYIGFSGERSTSGAHGEGALEVNSGASLNVGNDLVVGYTGDGSFTNRGTTDIGGDLYIGDEGDGELNNSGELDVDGDVYIGVGEYGELNNQSGGDFEVDGDVHVGYGDEGVLNTETGSTFTVNDNLYIGNGGEGTVDNSGTFTARDHVYVGYNDEGTLTNDGAFTIRENLYIGRNAEGTVENEEGGTFTVHGDIYVGHNDEGELNNHGTFTARDDLIVGNNAGGTLTNTGTLNVLENFTIGRDHDASASTSGLIDVRGHTTIGRDSDGSLTVRDDGELYTRKNLIIGASETGTLSIRSGGTVTTDGLVVLGETLMGEGVVVNRGDMYNNGGLVVGDNGEGSLVTTGRRADTYTDGNVIIGRGADGSGSVVVTRNADFDVDGALVVGGSGEGYFLVERGADATSETGIIAQNEGATGDARVTGRGSSWTLEEGLTLGAAADTNATLRIDDRGVVTIGEDGDGTLNLAAAEGSTAVLNIGGVEDGTARRAGTLQAGTVQFGEGEGTVNINHTGNRWTGYTFGAAFAGDGTVNHYSGYTILTGDSGEFAGALNLDGGYLVVRNKLNGAISVADGTLEIGNNGQVLGAIANEDTVAFNASRSNTVTYANVISGSGEVEQIGRGTTILTGENTYTGDTEIERGTLQIGDGGETGSISAASDVDISRRGTLVFNRSDNIAFSNDISGRGTLVQQGTGILTLSDTFSWFRGDAEVNAGTLWVNGNYRRMDVEVNNGGTLGGTGTVDDVVVRTGGTIAPGNSIGTLYIDGDFEQAIGSTYEVELQSTGETDLLVVDGNVSIADGAILNVTKLDDAPYQLDHVYTVIEADGDITGEYTLTGDIVSAFYKLVGIYTEDEVQLHVTQDQVLDAAALTQNQNAAAFAAQELKAQVDGDGHPTNELFRAIAYLSSDALAQQAFDLVSGEAHATILTSLVEDSSLVRDASGNRLGHLFAGSPENTGLWIEGTGAWGSVDGNGNAASFKRSNAGIVFGADGHIGQGFYAGALAGYSRSTLDVADRNSAVSGDNFEVGVYGGGEWNGLGLRAGASHAWSGLSSERNAVFSGFNETLSATYQARRSQVYGELAYALRSGTLSVEPFAGLAHVRVERDAYTETGGTAALSGASSMFDATFSTLGVRASAEFETGAALVRAEGSVGWRHALNSSDPQAQHSYAGSSAFTVNGTPLAQDVLVISAGLQTELSEGFTAGVTYAGQLSAAGHNHGVRGSLNWQF